MFVGRRPGLYQTWEDASLHVCGVTKGRCKSFATRKEAQEAFAKYLEDQVVPPSKGKTYVVFVGRKPGVYRTWEEAKAQVEGYSKAIFRGFKSEGGALKAFKDYFQQTGPSPVPDSANCEELEKRLEIALAERDAAFDLAGAYAEALAQIHSLSV